MAWLSVVGVPLAPAGCGADHDRVRRFDPPRAAEVGEVIAPSDGDGDRAEASSPEGESPEALDCGRAAAACEPGAVQACVLSCEATSDGCIVFSQFVPLGAVRSGYGVTFTALDPRGEYLYFSHSYSGGRWEVHPYVWTATGGVESLAAEFRAREDVADLPDRFVTIRQLGPGGSPLLGLNIEEDSAQTGFLWTREAGLTSLDFEPVAMSLDGGVIVGLRNGRAVVWQRSEGLRRLDGGDVDEAPIARSDNGIVLSASGEFATFQTAEGTTFRWSEASGLTDLRELVGETISPYTIHTDASGTVIFGSFGESGTYPRRVFRWTEATGLRDLGALAEMPEGSSAYSSRFVTSDGSVVVGTAQVSDGGAATFRWTEATGMELIASTPTGSSQPTYVSPNGDTIIGYHYSEAGFSSYRWSEQGLEVFDGDLRGGVALEGDLLIEKTAVDATAVHKFGRALDDARAELIDFLPPRLVPEGWGGASFEAVSDDGRLLVGGASDPAGQRQGWLVRLNRVCAE